MLSGPAWKRSLVERSVGVKVDDSLDERRDFRSDGSCRQRLLGELTEDGGRARTQGRWRCRGRRPVQERSEVAEDARRPCRRRLCTASLTLGPAEEALHEGGPARLRPW